MTLVDRILHPLRSAWRERVALADGRVVTLAPLTPAAKPLIAQGIERVSAEIGYWLGEPFWNRGIVSEALRAVTARAFDRFSLTRIYALPFADNAPSVRVLEKAGYAREGRMPRSAIKQGVVKDQLMYGAYR